MTKQEQKEVKDLRFNGSIACLVILAIIPLLIFLPMAKSAPPPNSCRMGAILSIVPSGLMKDQLDAKHARISFGCIAPAHHGWIVITSMTTDHSITYLFVPTSLATRVMYFTRKGGQ